MLLVLSATVRAETSDLTPRLSPVVPSSDMGSSTRLRVVEWRSSEARARTIIELLVVIGIAASDPRSPFRSFPALPQCTGDG